MLMEMAGSRKRFFLEGVFWILLALGLAGCSENSDSSTNNPEPVPLSQRFELRIGSVDFMARIAVTPSEQGRGLMYIREIPQNEGMLFTYPSPRQVSFWMKNTYIPLDIGFFDATGTLKEIYQMVPNDLRSTRSRAEDIVLALEMNRGWFSANEIRPGARLDLKKLRPALRQRNASVPLLD